MTVPTNGAPIEAVSTIEAVPYWTRSRRRTGESNRSKTKAVESSFQMFLQFSLSSLVIRICDACFDVIFVLFVDLINPNHTKHDNTFDHEDIINSDTF